MLSYFGLKLSINQLEKSNNESTIIIEQIKGNLTEQQMQFQNSRHDINTAIDRFNDQVEIMCSNHKH